MDEKRTGNSNQPYNYSHRYDNQKTQASARIQSIATRDMREMVYLIAGVVMAFFSLGMLPAILLGLAMYVHGLTVIGVVLCGGFGWGAVKLLRASARLRRAGQYRNFLAGWAGCTLKELSKVTGRPVSYLEKDLQEMIQRGELGNAWLDRTDGVLFTDEAAYRDYAQERRVRQKEKQMKKQEQKRATEPGFTGEVNRFQHEVEDICPEIDDVQVRAKVQQLSALIGEIRDWVKTHPEGEGKVKRLSNYYLPTTLKLLYTYISVDNNPGPTAQNICANVSNILDTFNTALRNMQDSLLDDTALDVSAEISALESMLQQEGLADSDFSLAPVRGEE